MATWFECKVKYTRLIETGEQKKVNEPYLVDALSFTEAEARITEEVAPFVSGDYTISAVKRTNINEIFWDETGDKWYSVKAVFIIIDERSGKEKKTATHYLVQAIDFKTAYDNFMENMKTTMSDFEVASITETPIMDVYRENLGGNSKSE